MYLYETKNGNAMQGDGFFQPKFDDDQIAKADRLEIWATSMHDSGEYCEFRLMHGSDIVAKKIIQGY